MFEKLLLDINYIIAMNHHDKIFKTLVTFRLFIEMLKFDHPMVFI